MRLRSLCIRTIKMKRQRHGNRVTQLNPGPLPNAPSAPPFSGWKSCNVLPETKTRIPNLPDMDPFVTAVSASSTVTLNRDLTFRGFLRLCHVAACAQQEVFPGCVTQGSSSN